jgi:hypothetical protein
VQSAIHRRTGKPVPSCQDVSRLPFELRRLFLLAPTPRDCFVLRILLRASMAKCSELLNLTIHTVEENLYAALQELPMLGDRSLCVRRREPTLLRFFPHAQCGLFFVVRVGSDNFIVAGRVLRTDTSTLSARPRRAEYHSLTT